MLDTIEFGTSKYIADNHPYLFEDHESAKLEVEALSDGTVDVYLLHPDYQSSILRDYFRKQFEKTGYASSKQRAERQYQWSGVELALTPKQARKLAKSLKRQAKDAEARRA